MRSKIEEMNARLEEIAMQRNDMGLKEIGGGMRYERVRERLPSTSLVDKSCVYGREKDKEAILELLLLRGESETSDDETISVIPIVGMGGVGKTTLAQLVYDDDNVKDHFDVKAWVCISDDFDVFEVTKTILQKVTFEIYNFKDLDSLQVKLKETLSGKRFLFVLDDVWNENAERWDLLRRPFLVGAPGSKIIFTTRNESVASVMSSVPAIPTYRLKKLSDADSQSLFAQYALGRTNFDAHPNLKVIGEKIVKKCEGLPLAAKTLGGLLRTELDEKRWEDILHSEIWELPQEKSNILPALRLSYFHLPAHLKQCFAYCSIFPKDYEFDKDELILLWMAEGLLQLKKGKKWMEDFGEECFDDLLSRSFFQQSSGNEAEFVMHDLVNDLAQFVAGEICFRAMDNFDGNEQSTISKRTRHLSYTRQKYEVFQKFKNLYGVQCLRTFLPLPVYKESRWAGNYYLSNRVLFDLLPKLHGLRVLSLSGYGITELPNSIGNLIHLRYLNLSHTSIQWLPKSVGALYNLQTLSLRDCKALCMLPATIVNLINLHHLDNANTNMLEEMPLGIGRLTNLQTLSKILVGKSNGSRLMELKDLLHLRGMVSIGKLQNVMNSREAEEANLMGKQYLDELELAWCEETDDSRNEKLAMDVLDILKPHINLKELKIQFYRGISFPSLVGCTKSRCLPALEQLPMLKNLYIQGMHEVKSVGVKFYTDGCSMKFPFPSLESLTFEDMPEWEEWCFFNNGVEEATGQFPCLRVLTVCKCPKLSRVSILRLPSLCELHLQECDEVVLRSVTDLTSLTTLKVKSVTGLSKLPEELMQFLVALEKLEFHKCEQMVTLWHNGFTLGEEDTLLLPFCKLECLEIRECANLENLPNGLNKYLTSLKRLHVSGCPKLVCFPEKGVPPMLKKLRLAECDGLNSLPESFSHLEYLGVENCSSLRSWPTDMFPTKLKEVTIWKCMQLEWVSETMVHENGSSSSMSSLENLWIGNWPYIGRLVGCLNHFANLLYLWIYNCDSLECFPETGLSIPNLTSLIIENCVNLRSLPPFHRIQSLAILHLYRCPNLELFGNGNLPPKLVDISVDADYGMPLSGWGLHKLTSLKEFSIFGGFSEMVCFPDNEEVEDKLCVFPASLTILGIWDLPNLESISSKGLRNLTSLQHLHLNKCPKLRSLPKGGLPSTLQHLNIQRCPLLKQGCRKDRGDYWPMIADIPCVEIDGYYIYENISE
ncbi:putative disease resistance RPP13-like protein 1 [Cornus florida]|uniref:putative disease resistance RPP13-like protein 1 n=1 Tax=Cornus florida TaxID=4283 RepID=UPI0028A1B77F|nr:putative disease resistance RPP13-like protein 1 [Cornus florida]